MYHVAKRLKEACGQFELGQKVFVQHENRVGTVMEINPDDAPGSLVVKFEFELDEPVEVLASPFQCVGVTQKSNLWALGPEV